MRISDTSDLCFNRMAAEAGDKTRLAEDQAKWNANGREIAAFLSGVNPAWKRVNLESMLQTHLDLATNEVVARLGGDWQADIRAQTKAMSTC